MNPDRNAYKNKQFKSPESHAISGTLPASKIVKTETEFEKLVIQYNSIAHSKKDYFKIFGRIRVISET